MIPFVLKNFYIFQITLAIIYAIAILGLNLLTGFNGQFSLGHSAFYAIGAYTAAIMMENMGIAYVWTLPAAAIVCFVFGFLFGLPALRLEGIYLALATFALAIAIPQVLKSSVVEHWTGGVQGIVIIKPDAPFGLPLNSDQWLYLFTVVVAIVMYVCAANLVKSRTGRALIAIRDHPVAASAMGINVSLYKSLTFGVSALYTGVAGALGAIAIAFVAPDSFTFVARGRAVRRPRGRRRRLDPRHVRRRLLRAVRAEHRRALLEGPRRRGLRGHPAADHLRDADGGRGTWCA